MLTRAIDDDQAHAQIGRGRLRIVGEQLYVAWVRRQRSL
jgi:hypothetical protein